MFVVRWSILGGWFGSASVPIGPAGSGVPIGPAKSGERNRARPKASGHFDLWL